MNRDRRKELEEVAQQLNELKDTLETIQADEEEYRDNILENLHGSERYEKADNACDNLIFAISGLEEVIEYVEEAAS